MTALTSLAKITKPHVPDQLLLIDGKWIPSVSGKTFETINAVIQFCNLMEYDEVWIPVIEIGDDPVV